MTKTEPGKEGEKRVDEQRRSERRSRIIMPYAKLRRFYYSEIIDTMQSVPMQPKQGPQSIRPAGESRWESALASIKELAYEYGAPQSPQILRLLAKEEKEDELERRRQFEEQEEEEEEQLEEGEEEQEEEEESSSSSSEVEEEQVPVEEQGAAGAPVGQAEEEGKPGEADEESGLGLSSESVIEVFNIPEPEPDHLEEHLSEEESEESFDRVTCRCNMLEDGQYAGGRPVHDHSLFEPGIDLEHATIYLTEGDTSATEDDADEKRRKGGEELSEEHLQWIHVEQFVFPASAFTPKILYPKLNPPEGKPLYQQMINQFKAQYESKGIAMILNELGLDPFEIIHPKYLELPPLRKYGLFSREHFVPIEYFYDGTKDVRTNEQWMDTSLGVDNCYYPVPAMGFIPWAVDYKEYSPDEAYKYMAHRWEYVAVYQYNEATEEFTVVPVTLEHGPYNIHRIYICFKAENPMAAAARIIKAYKMRNKAEVVLRFEDIKEFTKKSNYAEPVAHEWNRIIDMATRNGRIRKFPKSIHSVLNFYELTMTDLLLRKFVAGTPVYSYLNVPEKVVWQPKLEDIVTGSTVEIYEAMKTNFNRDTIYALRGIYEAIVIIFNLCLDLPMKCMFELDKCHLVTLQKFIAMQKETLVYMEIFIRKKWCEGITETVIKPMANQGDGYYNLNECSYKFFELSKVYKILWLVKFLMEHALRELLKKSIIQYDEMFESACRGLLDLEDDFSWGEDLVETQFPPATRSVFTLVLHMNEDGPYFCTDLSLFKPAVMNAYDTVVNSMHAVSMIDRWVAKNIKYPPIMYLLNCVSLLGGEIQKCRASLEHCLTKAVIPVNAYLHEYERHMEFYLLDVEEYVTKFKDEMHLASEVTKEIQEQQKLKEELEATLPEEIVIGMFQIDTHLVRDMLMKKRETIRVKHLEAHAARMKKTMQDSMEDYMNIYRRLCEKPNAIENIIELKEWMETVPLSVKAYDDAIHTKLLDYEVLDYFYYSLSDADFATKWDAITWPYKIKCKMDETELFLIDETERFLKLQAQDEAKLQDKIDYLSSIISNLSGQDDVEKVHPIAVDVRQAWKGVKEAQEFGLLLNQRQKLFGIPVTPFDDIPRLIKEFEPYKNLWGTASDWRKARDLYMDNPLAIFDADLIDPIVSDYYKTMVKCIRLFKDIPACQKIAIDMKAEIEDFRPLIPVIQALKHPGMKPRHWAMFKEKTGVNIALSPYQTFKQCLGTGILNFLDELKEAVDGAAKEYVLEQALDKMEGEWEGATMSVTPFKATGTYIMKVSDEQIQMLDDHIALTQQLTFSPYKGAFEERILEWNDKIRLASDVLDAWFECQKSWMYLEPILTSEDIARQLPLESKRFSTVQRSWRRIMKRAYENPTILDYCSSKKLLEQFNQNNKILEAVTKGLTEYLELKRLGFPRLFFLSDDELLEILSQSKFPWAVQPHLKKCFENIYKLDFLDGTHITEMFSGEGEKVKLIPDMYASGSVEVWLARVEEIMRNTIRETISKALKVIEDTPKTKWVLDWPGQVVIAGSQTYWTAHVEKGILTRSLKQYFQTMLSQLDGLRSLLKSKLTRVEREVMSALIVIEVHARDVLQNLVELRVTNVNEFDWISQLRYYWVVSELKVRAVNAEFQYGYEYLGNSGRLVITPLTDRCYLTLTGALHLKFGGAPAGPAGTGKTETTKDLAKAFAIQCVVFNCSDQLDFKAMGKFFKGLASSGAWACFDEFNRIDIEVLSVIAQQITTIQKAQMTRAERFMFEGTELVLKAACAVFITMNPGYAGRTELPDNLKALFRPVAMMVPNYTLIAEISLFSYGFMDAKLMAGKITTTFKLSSEQLSSQDHYDFGMRAVKTVIAAAGNLKRENPDMEEKQIVLRALKDVNVPKFLRDDLKLFNGIVSDLFPRMQEQHVDYGLLELSIRNTCVELGLEDVDEYVMKVIQLYETTVVRHGLMLVGPTGSGKTKCYEILKMAMTHLRGEMSPSGSPFQSVWTYVLNPKSITMGQLYGEFDLLTHEWTDGILPSMVRIGASATDDDKRWYVFDGPVDAVWIENMNTVLDDNKKLCLTSGEIIKLTSGMTLMFEVADLAVASPATVSRCGMVYIEPSVLGLQPFINCWIKRMPQLAKPLEARFRNLFDTYLLPAVKFLRSDMREIVGSVDSAIVLSFLKLLDFFLGPLTAKDGRPPPSAKFIKNMPQLQPVWVIFCLVWSVGATCDANSQAKFSTWLLKIMEDNNEEPAFPPDTTVYDFRFHDGGFTMPTQSGEPEPPTWYNWMTGIPEYKIAADTKYSDIEVPTINSVRNSELLGMLLVNESNVLCVGPTGTGKTLTVLNKLSRGMPKKFVSDFLNFSARTSANQTQDLIDSKLDKRRRGVFGPPVLKRLALFIDDFNMPALEVYGAQPPIELIRQWMDFGGWYDRKNIGDFRRIVDVNFVAGMGPPGGGRNPVTARLLRHFHYLAFTELDDDSKRTIFSTILESWLSHTSLPEDYLGFTLKASLEVYSTVITELLPTPAKTHYTFNLRDLSKVFQGVLMCGAEDVPTEEDYLRLWYHENCRVYEDRMVNDKDRSWFQSLLSKKIAEDFRANPSVILGLQFLFADFFQPEFRHYSIVTDMDAVTNVVINYLADYNSTSTAPMNLVLFFDAISHISRICRIIRQPLGNALLLGMGGSGRQSLTRLSAHINEMSCFQIVLNKNFGVNEWRDNVKDLMIKAGVYNKETVFLFSDTQIKYESFLEDLNNMLNSGDVPNIYQAEELDLVYQAMRVPVTDAQLDPTKSNLFQFYLKQVKSNLHAVITMSPIGEIFRARLRQFPALVNCCTIDWFSPWPDAALESVAQQFLQNQPYLTVSEEVLAGIVTCCMRMHQSVIQASDRFLKELSRHNYVTPTSYLQLLYSYLDMMERTKKDQMNAINRLQGGLDKLYQTAKDVEILQADLEAMQPELVAAREEATIMVEKIEADKMIAEVTKEEVEKEERAAAKMAEETQAIADDAAADLLEVLPMLKAAENSLKALNKGDISEVRSLKRPPEGVVLVLETICIIKNIKPSKVMGPDGRKVDDYWEPGRNMLADPGAFLNSLMNFDKEKLNETLIAKLKPYIDNTNFRPAKIITVSKACTSLCQWVHAMVNYYHVNLTVAPKKAALNEAQEKLEKTEIALAKSRARMRAVQEGLDRLLSKLNETIARKKELEDNSELCEARLKRAFRLIDGLSGESVRWKESVANMKVGLGKITGNILVSAGAVAYLSPFTEMYRHRLFSEWVDVMTELNIPHTDNCKPTEVLGDPVDIRNWQLQGLPRDALSTENAILVNNSTRWPLFIDPQGQANKWIKNMSRGRNLKVMKPTDKELMREMERALTFGWVVLIENLGTSLDQSLDPILAKQTFIQNGELYIKLGEAVIPYNPLFKLYLTTKLPNPHYTPEVSVKVLVVNFALVPSGLQDQLLAQVVMQERPDLEEARSRIIVSSAQMKSELKDIENKILSRLTESQGNPVDDVDLINTLEESKVMSAEIRSKVEISAETQTQIDAIRLTYIPVAERAQILFFCVADLARVDPMYQYSLEWFTSIFIDSMDTTEKVPDVPIRIGIINDYFTFALYCRVCRSLFERNKLQFAFLLCVRILLNRGEIDHTEWTFFLAGGSPLRDLDNPVKWLTQRSWTEILSLENLPFFKPFVQSFITDYNSYRHIIESATPHREPLAKSWESMGAFRKMMVIKCLRPDKVTNFMQDYLSANMGQRFIEPQTVTVADMYKDSGVASPLVFILSPGTDPAAELYKFADKLKMTKRLSSISLGQGQGPIAEAMFLEAVETGGWVFFQNCHLAPSWMPRLEYLVENIVADSTHKAFRVWLTSTPSPHFPVTILQNGSKMTIEPPRGVKANLLRSYTGQVTEFNDFLESENPKVQNFKWLLFSLCLFHGVCIERRKFGPLGFNIPYEFTDGDLRICISQLHMFLLEYDEVPFKVLSYTAGQINYGGRVTDDWDRRCIMNILSDYYNPKVLRESHAFDENKCYYQLSFGNNLLDYTDYIKALPMNDAPALFGLHDNADISCAQAETYNTLNVLLSLQSKKVGSESASPEEITTNIANTILSQVPKPFANVRKIQEKYPVLYEESLNTVLIQEVIRFNKLLSVIHSSLQELLKALKGLVVMSESLEKMSEALFKNAVPAMWAAKAYPSLKPLGAWVSDLQLRIEFINMWIATGIPACFWISGFYFPQAFLTGCLQNYARKHIVSIDSLNYRFEIMKLKPKERPADGCAIYGLFLEGARWSSDTMLLAESFPKELYTNMSPIWLLPEQRHKKAPSGVYECPVYKTLQRAGTLSTTGHSTNYVLAIEVPTNREEAHWIKRGVALFCALDY